MLVLLPPSESKLRTVTTGAATVPGRLSSPALAGAREVVVQALLRAAGAPDPAAALGLGPALAAEAAANAHLRTAPAVPVARLYTGVLHDALGLGTLPDDAAARAADEVLVFSALWGVLTPADAVAPYRLSMGTRLDGTGALAAFWRAPLAEALQERTAGHLLVDCRSSAYVAAWPLTGARASRGVAVRVLRERDGRRTVVSHHAKHARGVLARRLLMRGQAEVRTPHDLAALAADGPWSVQLHEPGTVARPWTLDLVGS